MWNVLSRDCQIAEPSWARRAATRRAPTFRVSLRKGPGALLGSGPVRLLAPVPLRLSSLRGRAGDANENCLRVFARLQLCHVAHLTRGSLPEWAETPARWLGRRSSPIEPCPAGSRPPHHCPRRFNRSVGGQNDRPQCPLTATKASAFQSMLRRGVRHQCRPRYEKGRPLMPTATAGTAMLASICARTNYDSTRNCDPSSDDILAAPC